jgi:putative addiction module component (TIGR02574 family)
MIERIPELRTLSPVDKLALVTELRDDLASNPEDLPITPAQIAEVERHLEEYGKNPGWYAIQRARLHQDGVLPKDNPARFFRFPDQDI